VNEQGVSLESRRMKGPFSSFFFSFLRARSVAAAATTMSEEEPAERREL